MDEDDDFGDLYSDVIQPPVVLPPPPPLPHRLIDLNLRSEEHDEAEANYASVSKVFDDNASKSTVSLSQDAIGDGDAGDDKEMKFDIEEPDSIPGLFVTTSGTEDVTIRGLGTDRDRGRGGGEGDDWDSDSEDDLQIVLNDTSRIGADRTLRMGGNEEDDDDDDDDEEPLVIVADSDANQTMDEQIWGEDQAVDGDGKEGGEAGKGSGIGPSKSGYTSHGYHPFHSQFKVSVNASKFRLLSGWATCCGLVLVFVESECI